MSSTTRQELARSVTPRYREADRRQKCVILDEFVAATGYARKHAIVMLGREEVPDLSAIRVRKRRYDEPVIDALTTLWRAGNSICSKRLVPFLPELLGVMERCGHISLTPDIRDRLLSMSVSTADRALSPERQRTGHGISTTKPGQLLKRQITVRTFADWDDIRPGFFEIDLVAHCGDWAGGSFLHTLVLTDVATGWIECCPLLHRGEVDVTTAITEVRSRLPFPVLGLDTDNGSEFINYEMLRYCERESITFTRARTYKKNDQCHVEEKNGSVVRRLIGYSRYEGTATLLVMAQIYDVLRQYVNFFQPSLKLASKQRDGSHVTKKYEIARTPYQRLVTAAVMEPTNDTLLKSAYGEVDPLALLSKLAELQTQLWPLARPMARSSVTSIRPQTGQRPASDTPAVLPPTVAEHAPRVAQRIPAVPSGSGVTITAVPTQPAASQPQNESQRPKRAYRRVHREHVPHTWRTHKDPFADVSERLWLLLALDPERTAKDLLSQLLREQPDRFTAGQLRTLQRRVRVWRREQVGSDIRSGAIVLDDQ